MQTLIKFGIMHKMCGPTIDEASSWKEIILLMAIATALVLREFFGVWPNPPCEYILNLLPILECALTF